MKNNKLKLVLCAIFILALFLRLMAVFSQEESKKIPLSDAKGYNNVAVNILSGNGFSLVPKIPTAYRPPLYPLFLALIYSIFGHSYIAVKVIQAILSAFVCIAIFFIADIIYNDKKIGILSFLLTASYVPFISWLPYYGTPAWLLSENLYMPLVVFANLTLILFIKKEKSLFGILTGIAMGLAALTRSEFILYPIFLSFYLFYISRLSIKKGIKKYFIVYFFIILTIAPWTIRNYMVHKEFIPFSTIGGENFLAGNNSSANGSWGRGVKEYREIVQSMQGLSEYEADRALFKKGLEDLKRNSKRIPRLIIRKILVHWAPFENGFKIFNPYYAIVLLFGSIGILFFRRHSILENILLINFLSTTIAAVIIYGDPRFRFSYESLLIIFSAVAISKIFILIQKRCFKYKFVD